MIREMKNNLALHNPHLDGAPFVWESGPVGVLLSHGYTATPAEVRLLAIRLHQQGYTVAAPLLPGHGTTPQEMNRCRWQDWTEAIEQAYQQLTQRCQRVIVGGESMGALLSLYLASEHPEIEAVLTYAPALRIARKLALAAHLLAPFVPHVPKGKIKEEFWQGYLVNPVQALAQMHWLQRQVRQRLAKVKQPLLIVQGRLDTAIDLRGVDDLYYKVGSSVKELHWLENSGHVVIIDRERDQAADLTVQFLNKVLR